jgi:hypothetical protein
MNCAHRRERRNRARQRGVALLLALLVAVASASFVALRTLNAAAAHRALAVETTHTALAAAKRALLGYAIAYADGSHAMSKGPGHLPCPDRAGGSEQGSAEGVASDCRAADGAETGLLPWRTLGVAELRDGSGARLWYAVAETYRSHADPPLNSETPAALRVDSLDDIVAVIIAPGAALGAQVRDSASTYTASAWLEDDNASAGDNRFTRRTHANANDTLVYLTRAELMAAVEQVVTGEVAEALASYESDPDADGDEAGCAGCDDGLPWLAALGDDSFTGRVWAAGEDIFGHLPLSALNVEFDAAFTADWLIGSSGTLTSSGAQPPSALCLRASACTQTYSWIQLPYGALFGTKIFSGTVAGTPGGEWLSGRCTLSRSASPAAGTPGGRVAERSLHAVAQREPGLGVGRQLSRDPRFQRDLVSVQCHPPVSPRLCLEFRVQSPIGRAERECAPQCGGRSNRRLAGRTDRESDRNRLQHARRGGDRSLDFDFRQPRRRRVGRTRCGAVRRRVEPRCAGRSRAFTRRDAALVRRQ